MSDTQATNLYQAAQNLFDAGDHAAALSLFERSNTLIHHPIAALRIAQCQFILDTHDQIEFPKENLTDGWIRLGIFVSALNEDQQQLRAWLSKSAKTTNSKKIQTFLKAVEAQNANSSNPVPQNVKELVQTIKDREFAKLIKST